MDPASERNENLEETVNAKITADIQKGCGLCTRAVHLSNQIAVKRRQDKKEDGSSVKEVLSKLSERSLQLCSSILQIQGIKCNLSNRDVEEQLDVIVSANDLFLDQARENLNILNGICFNTSESAASQSSNKTGSWNLDLRKSVIWKERISSFCSFKGVFEKRAINKPQLKFPDPVDNSSVPFVPRITDKPNALVPLSLITKVSLDGAVSYCNPYEYEIDHFEVPESQLTPVTPTEPRILQSTLCTYVDNENSLNSMLEHLEQQSEIAVDLEHHDHRSFQGFTCLMQISSRMQDFIIDTLALRDKLQILNKIFTNPNVVKVFHGSDSDVLWLQRDFGVYVVNMFDTYQASVLLNFKRLSLLHLLKEYCGVEPNKRFQLLDWRIRPLPEDALFYARGDTHYLLYIYDMLRNRLIEAANGDTNLLKAVYTQSSNVCKKRYEKNILTDESHLRIYKLSQRTFDSRQMNALREIYRWRDIIARTEDESTGYVLPNHMLLQIADTLPREAQGILACCNPVPPLVRKHLLQIHQLVHTARNQPLEKLMLDEETPRSFTSQGSIVSRAPMPHDFSHCADFRPNLPTLLSGTDVVNCDHKDVTLPALKPLVEEQLHLDSVKEGSEVSSQVKQQVSFVSPYQRYRRTIIFRLAQEDEERAKKEQEKTKEKLAINVQNLEAEVKGETGSLDIKKEPQSGAQDVRKELDTSTVERSRGQQAKIRMRLPASKRRKRGTRSEEPTSEEVAVKNEIAEEATSGAEPPVKQPKVESIVTESSPLSASGSGQNKKLKLKKKNCVPPFDYSKVEISKFISAPNAITKQLRKLNNQIRKNIKNNKLRRRAKK